MANITEELVADRRADDVAKISDDAAVRRKYTVGTLRYTRGALVVVFTWLLWGDFCSTVYGIVFGNFLPLYLRGLHAPNTLIAFLGSGVGGAVNVLLLPNISMWSDRHRGRWGRRIPFLFWSTPVVALSLIGLGYASPISGWLHGAASPLHAFPVAATAMAVVSFMVLVAAISQMILINVYQFLMRDVVPQEVMPWFLTLFRVVGVVASAGFSWFFFRYIVAHPKVTCVSTGLLFMTAFFLICWRVREGDYPPPPPRPKGGVLRHALANYLGYFRECLSAGIYRNYVFVFILTLAGNAAVCSFGVLFATRTLGVSADDYGKILALATAGSGVVYIPMGYLCKHWHALGVALVSLLLLAIGLGAAYFFVDDKVGWLVYSIAITLPTVGWALASFIVTMALFPAAKFGQFSSSLNAIGFGSLVITSYLVGRCMDLFDGNYRVAFLIGLVCYAAALLPMYGVYRGWKRHGGPNYYVPPLPRSCQEAAVPESS